MWVNASFRVRRPSALDRTHRFPERTIRSFSSRWRLAAGTEYLQDRIPGTLEKLGLSGHPDLLRMVECELGKMLAADPNTKVAGATPIAANVSRGF